jgi:hypothetical protein
MRPLCEFSLYSKDRNERTTYGKASMQMGEARVILKNQNVF